ncbi:MAG: hypothetical protein MK081_04370 [Flavobacteriales bacterium]|nr:hypothetical protein [Flavobacteriales bacterium]
MSRLVGALWIAIALVSIAGAIRPVTFSTVLVIQLIYKGLWLILVALPAFNTKYPYPRALAIFFAIWVFVLPFIIPWKTLFA